MPSSTLTIKSLWLLYALTLNAQPQSGNNLGGDIPAVIKAKDARRAAAAKHDKINEVSSLNDIAIAYWKIRGYDSARTYATYALSAGAGYHIDSLQGDAWMILGIIDHSQGHYTKAMESYGKSIPLYKKKNQVAKIAKAYLNIGKCLKQLSRFGDAIRYYLLAARDFERLKDDNNLGNTYNSIGLCFTSLANYPKAIEYNRKTLGIRIKQNDDVLTAQSLNNIGFSFKMDGQIDSSIYYLSKSITLYSKKQDSSLLVLPLQNIGSSWKMRGNYPPAEAFISRSLNIAARYDMKEELARGNLDLAELYISKKLYKKASGFAKITEKTAAEANMPELLMNAYEVEMNLYEQNGDYKNAHVFNKRRDKIRDSLFTAAKNKEIEELDIKYQTEQRLKDIASLHTQNNLQSKIVSQQTISIAALSAAAILLLFLFIVAYNNFRIKDKANKRIQTLMQDLHHRVKNNLQMLSGLFVMQIENMSDEGAKNALRENETRLASMNLIHHKLYLDNANSQIEMQEYLSDLLYHIQDSFGGDRNIILRLGIEPIKLEADKAVAIGLIVNELSTNAFKYAFDEKGGEIYLGLQIDAKSRLILKLQDNGKGFTNTGDDNKASFGLKLVNLMAKQLHTVLIKENTSQTSYRMEVDI